MNKVVKPLQSTNIFYISGRTTEELQRKLDEIVCPYAIIGSYGLNNLHWLVLETEKRIIIKNRREK